MNSIASRAYRVIPRALRGAVLILGFAALALGCNSDDGDSFSVDGNWEGFVSQADAEFTLLLFKEGKKTVGGSALVTVEPAGQVSGDVNGTLDGADVTFTIEIDDVIVGGSVVFEGSFESDDVMKGTVDSGIIGGTFPITFQRL